MAAADEAATAVVAIVDATDPASIVQQMTEPCRGEIIFRPCIVSYRFSPPRTYLSPIIRTRPFHSGDFLMTRLRISAHVLFTSLLALLVASCSDSTSPGDGSGVLPGVGSRYTTTVTVEDGSGGILSSQNQSATVEHAPGYRGKENVAKYVPDGGGQDMYLAFEDDGKVSIEFLLTLAGQSDLIWVPITATPGSPTDEEVYRQTQVLGGGVSLVTTARVTAESAGTESVTVKGEDFEAKRTTGKIIATFEYVGAGSSTDISYDFDVAWIEELKMFGRYDLQIEGGPQLTRQVLIDYELK